MLTRTLYSLCITVIIFSGWAFSATPVMATGIDYVPLAPIDVRGSEFTSPDFQGGTFSSCRAPTCFPRYLRTIYNVGVALAGLFAVFSIVNGGFTLLFTDSILGHSEGKAMILRAMGGLVIVYASYIFMNQISPSLGRDLDLSLAFERVPKALTGRGLTVVPALSNEEAYNKFLDDALKRAQTISQKAVSIKDTIEQLEKRMEEGDYKDAAEAGQINESINKLRVAETTVRSYEGAVDYLSTNMRTQIRQCVQGVGACSLPSGVTDLVNPLKWTWSGGLPAAQATVANKNQTENNAVVTRMIEAAKGKVAEDALKLRASGLLEEAADLEKRMQTIQTEAEFYKRCPQTKATYAAGRGYENPSTACPP